MIFLATWISPPDGKDMSSVVSGHGLRPSVYAEKQSMDPMNLYLVGGFSPYPSEKWWSESQLGWWHSQYDGKNNPFMFQTTKQL